MHSQLTAAGSTYDGEKHWFGLAACTGWAKKMDCFES